MRYTTRINNRKCLEWGINAAQAALFDLLNECAGWAKPVVVDGEVFHWVSRHLVVEELPLFFSKPDTAYRAMKALEEKGLIEYQRNGNWELVRITAKGATWNSHDAAKENSDSDSPEKNPSVRKNFREVGKKSEVPEADSYHSEKYPSSPEKNPNGSEKFPRDKYINKQITNHGINQDCSARACGDGDFADDAANADNAPIDRQAKPEKRTKPSKRAMPVPEDFQPNEADLAWFAKKGFGFAHEPETEKFVLWWRARGDALKDWHAAWKNWMVKAQEFAQRDELKANFGNNGYGNGKNHAENQQHNRKLTPVERVQEAQRRRRGSLWGAGELFGEGRAEERRPVDYGEVEDGRFVEC